VAPVAEFDAFADDYTELHRHNIRVSGEAPDYFARYKIETLRARWTALGLAEPADILDFGCGVGASLPHLAELFPTSAVLGLDVSEASLAVARARSPAGVSLRAYDGTTIDLPAASQDLIFSACVFHHIEPEARGALLRQLHALLRPGGILVIYEHNPLNPVTRYIVATCPFDENAVLTSAWSLASLQRAAGFKRVRTTYTGFFPAALAGLRRLEPSLGWAPLGAQYYTLSHA
jgi:SAM-dependent methyltransferase